jgi:hypothetical protein
MPEEGQLAFEKDRGQEIPRRVNLIGDREIGVTIEMEETAEAEVEIEVEVGNGSWSRSRSHSLDRSGSGNGYENQVMIGDEVGITEAGFGQGINVGEIENPADDEGSDFPMIRIEDDVDFW